MENETNCNRVPCLVTNAQLKAIRSAADAKGISVSAFMRMAALEMVERIGVKP